ncbi:MAG: orc1/cdc6 family replication initiation protein [Thermoplasmata archaeon HGW-Thermoplasmata-1]|nr:MAG: orc1/cdc6 family replication initiation protein [Thermoplasmata archaeon HGW-Thermoplasmata-1]
MTASIIEQELARDSVFRDLSKLDFDYVPEELVNRGEHLRRLAQLFKPVIESGAPASVLITGSVGTGKTAISKLFCRDFAALARKQGADVDWVLVNCRKRQSDTRVLQAVLTHYDPYFPDRGFALPDMLHSLRKQLERKEQHLIIVLDEVDVMLGKSGQDLIYALTRFSDEAKIRGKAGISLMLVSQYDILQKFDDAALSTFGRGNYLKMDKYARDELYDIANQRIGLAFKTGTVDDDSAQLVADIAEEWGDARFVIELLWKAGLFADEAHSDLVTPENVRAAKAETYSVITEAKLRNLERHELFTLMALGRKLAKSGRAYATTGEVEENYALVAEEFGEESRGHTQFWKYLKSLDAGGFLSLRKSGKGVVGTTQLISLPDVPGSAVCEKIAELV